MRDSDPIIAFSPPETGDSQSLAPANANGPGQHSQRYPISIRFNRQELSEILAVYGRKVAEGEWRDYAIDMGREKAVFSIFRRSSECALLRIEKNPRLARRQGAYSVIAATGHILKRGHDLRRVLGVLEKGLRLVR